MQRLWAPWREGFILGKKERGCIFCKWLKAQKDNRHYILYRGESCFVILNLYPYNTGHLMVVPNRHAGSLEDLADQETQELMTLSAKSVAALRSALKPEGFNLGMNLGCTAGAGIADHLHLHIVPRWSGDTNFMPVLAETKVLSLGLKTLYAKLKKAF
ncbi:MAG: HIT family hydrolase [candidate division Zixibacteria bacterium RBG_16_50_21]|nr:MAG: HIT family hydrolase [candidate division Zixibacteria bacterium RBG_16_50_21]